MLAGLAEEDLLPCVDWMSPFWDVLKEEVPEYDKKFSKLLPGFTKSNVVEDSHNLQKHDISLTMMVSIYIVNCVQNRSIFNHKVEEAYFNHKVMKA